MVYVDSMKNCIKNANWPYLRACHLIADSLSELHEFAKKSGLRRGWFRGGYEGKIPHYDLTTNKRASSIRAGAIEIDMPSFACRIREYRLRWAVGKYIDAKAVLIMCQQRKMRLSCVRCNSYKGGKCAKYKDYFDSWMLLQANMKHVRRIGG